MPGTGLSALHKNTSFTSHHSRMSHKPHFTGQETEAEVKQPIPNHTCRKWEGLELGPDFLDTAV